MGTWPDQVVTHSSAGLGNLSEERERVGLMGKREKRRKGMKHNRETRGRTRSESLVTKGITCHAESLLILLTMGNTGKF